jgi:CubicO group peptidase (beta-lactamase class C family)
MCSSSDEIVKMRSAEETMDIMQPTMDRMIKEQYMRGAVVALLVDGEVSFKSYGCMQTGIQLTPEEVAMQMTFEIGSITKGITGLALASLIQEGKVNPKSTLGECLPGIDKDMPASKITLEQLASHSSGLPRLPNDLLEKSPDVDPYSKYTKDHLVANLNRLDGIKVEKAAFEYSNFGAGVLSTAIVAQSGKPSLESLLKERVFDPLEMTSTTLKMPLHTTGHSESLEPAPAWNFDSLAGAGAVRSSPLDMAKLLYALAYPEKTPLQAAIEHATKPILEDTPQRVGSFWILDGDDIKDVIWHDGGTAGYSSFIGVHKPTKRGVLLMSNTNCSLSTTTAFDFLSTLLGKNSSKTSSQLHEYYGESIPRELLEEYGGVYTHSGKLSFKVKTRGPDVWVQLPKHPYVKAYPENPFRFHLRSLNAQIDFDGIDPGLPPHTLTYTQGAVSVTTTREGQEFRKFLKNTKRRIIEFLNRF